MAYTLNPFILSTLLTITALISSASMVESRPFSSPSSSSLAVRLKTEGESSYCWDSLWQLQACSGEIVTFFLNDTQYCTNDCWQIQMGDIVVQDIPNTSFLDNQ
ncbi:Egg cell-secreted protein 1.1 [Glycine soja]